MIHTSVLAILLLALQSMSTPRLDMCVADRLYVMEVTLTSQNVTPFITSSCGLAALLLPFATWESRCLTFPGGKGFLLVRWTRRGCSSSLASGGKVELSILLLMTL